MMTKLLVIFLMQDPLPSRFLTWIRNEISKNQKVSSLPQDRYEEWVDKQW